MDPSPGPLRPGGNFRLRSGRRGTGCRRTPSESPTPRRSGEPWRRRKRTSIVLAPGSYDSRQPFFNPYGHRIYAARHGQAVLRAGLSLGGNEGAGGALVRGVVVDVDEPRRTVDGAAIAVWGTGARSRILDTTLRGNGVVPAGVAARRPDGLVVRRVVVRGFTDFGVLADANDVDRGKLREPLTVEDVDVARVGRPDPGSSNGRAEACVWIGNTGSVRRVRARSCAWSGLWTGTATHGAAFDEIDVDHTPTGVYIEHFTHDSTFRRLRIGPDVRIGLTAEWADPAWGRRPASVGNLIEDSRFDSRVAGVYLDEGTTRTTIRRSTFVSQAWAAIGDYRGNGNAAYANDYQGSGRGQAGPSEHRSGRDEPWQSSPAPRRPSRGSPPTEAFEALAGQWDDLVRAMPRPSPFLLHGWLTEWWRHYGGGAELAVDVCRHDGRLVGALPLIIRRRAGLRVASFMGDRHAVLPDLLLSDDADSRSAAPDRIAHRGPLRCRRPPRAAGGQPHRGRAGQTARGHRTRRGAGARPRRRMGRGLSRQDDVQEAQPAPPPPPATRRAGAAHGLGRSRSGRARARAGGGVPASRSALGGTARRLGIRDSARHALPPCGRCVASPRSTCRGSSRCGSTAARSRSTTGSRSRDACTSTALRSIRRRALVTRSGQHARHDRGRGRRRAEARRVPRRRGAVQGRAGGRVRAAVPWVGSGSGMPGAPPVWRSSRTSGSASGSSGRPRSIACISTGLLPFDVSLLTRPRR